MYGTKAANISTTELQSVDTGNPGREKHRGGIFIAPRRQTEGGIVTDVGASVRFECALDELMGSDPAKGFLAGSEGAKRDREAVARSRYEAGMKLRRLFVKAGLVPVKSFDPNATGGGSGLSDAQEMARAKYNGYIRNLGQWGEIAAGAACYDLLPDNDRWRSNVRRALDRLCEMVL